MTLRDLYAVHRPSRWLLRFAAVAFGSAAGGLILRVADALSGPSGWTP